MYNITSVVEKNDDRGFMKKESIHLVEIGGQIAHTLTPRHGDFNVQHCNLIIEFRELQTMSYTEVKEEKIIAAMRGRNPENTSENFLGSEFEQKLEINNSGISNAITTVQKDNLVLDIQEIPNTSEISNKKAQKFIYKSGNKWWLIRIRKLTPRECWRLMGFYDEDFDKAEKVNSNTQLYKQAGNSIVVNVLEDIFKQMMGD